MSIDKLSPKLLKIDGATNGDVLTYVSANSTVEWAAPTGGGGGGDVANVWVNANDYNTYTTLSGFIDTVQDNIASLYGTTLYQGLDSDVFLLDSSTNSFSLSYSVASNNDILVSISGVVQTPDQYIIASNVLTISNTTPLPANVYLEVRKLFPGVYDEANVYNTYTTLTANIYNTFAYLNANVGGGGGGDVSNSWVNANDYNSYTTLTANIYNTFQYLNANVSGGDVANAWVNANDYSTFTTLTANIYNTFAYLNANVGGGGGGGITTGKAIAMAMIFGG